MIWSWVIFALTLAGKLAIDYKQHMGKKNINHRKEGAIVFILLVVACFLNYLISGELWLSGLLLGTMLLNFWAWMDTGFGLLISRDPFFLGDSADLDRMQKRFPALQWAKYLLAAAAAILYIIKG